MTPKPVTVKQVCSVCGLDWKLHGKAPTTEKCVELLLDEVRALNARLAHRPVSIPYVPAVRPWPWPTQPWRSPWQAPWGGTTAISQANFTPAVSAIAPRPLNAA